MPTPSDTIAALSTPRGTGAIGILRLSGPGAVPIAKKCFRPLSPRALEENPPRTLAYGELLDREGRPIDRVLCTYSRGPGSYTGEDTAELHCHGSPGVLALGLEALFAAGARQAGPGEFTRRAFLNGKLDLAQAEAVGDLLEAGSRESVRNAAGQLGGALSRRTEAIYSGLTDLLAHFHAVLDYPDEDIAPFTERTVRAALDGAVGRLDALLATYARGSLLAGGVPCAIVGRPNVGKSSLLNALLGYERAIVTDLPGTTRDTLEERVSLGGVTLRLTDTAGLREAADEAERLGVARSRAAMEGARLILAVLDRSRPWEPEDGALLRQAAALAPTIAVLNKADLPRRLEPGAELGTLPRVEVSARTGQGLDALERAVAGFFPDGGEEAGSLLTNARQAEAAGRARDSLRRAREALKAGMTPDALLSDVEEAMAALGELTGRCVSEDVTDRIFSKFCVGK